MPQPSKSSGTRRAWSRSRPSAACRRRRIASRARRSGARCRSRSRRGRRRASLVSGWRSSAATISSVGTMLAPVGLDLDHLGAGSARVLGDPARRRSRRRRRSTVSPGSTRLRIPASIPDEPVACSGSTSPLRRPVDLAQHPRRPRAGSRAGRGRDDRASASASLPARAGSTLVGPGPQSRRCGGSSSGAGCVSVISHSGSCWAFEGASLPERDLECKRRFSLCPRVISMYRIGSRTRSNLSIFA